MKQFETAKYKNQSLELDVKVSSKGDTVWLSKEQMALLYNRDRSVISKHINNIYKEGELDKKRTCAKNAQVQMEGTRRIQRFIDYYNLDVILSVGFRVGSPNGLRLKEWFEGNISKNRQIIVYDNGNVRLDVEVEPLKDTVWLSATQMALLFATSVDNIYWHIKNIYNEGEIDRSVTEESSATQKEIVLSAADGKPYLTSLYNLDVILAVGYRVKGKRAIEFRKWASSVLKQYLLKGYAIDKKRTLVTDENYIHLISEVNSLKDDVKEIKETLATKTRNAFICYEGQSYEGLPL